MKLLYYGDVMPADYEPPFFRGCTEEEVHNPWNKIPLKMEVKSVLDPCEDENMSVGGDSMERDKDSEAVSEDLSTGWLQCDPGPLFTPETFTLPGWHPEWFPWKKMQILPVQWHALGLGLFASVIAPFRGFFASGFRRVFKIKDFGDSIHGHGGMTDRMEYGDGCLCIHLPSVIHCGSKRISWDDIIFDQVLICEHVHKSAHSNGTCGNETTAKPEILLNIYDVLCFCVVGAFNFGLLMLNCNLSLNFHLICFNKWLYYSLRFKLICYLS